MSITSFNYDQESKTIKNGGNLAKDLILTDANLCGIAV